MNVFPRVIHSLQSRHSRHSFKNEWQEGREWRTVWIGRGGIQILIPEPFCQDQTKNKKTSTWRQSDLDDQRITSIVGGYMLSCGTIVFYLEGTRTQTEIQWRISVLWPLDHQVVNEDHQIVLCVNCPVGYKCDHPNLSFLIVKSRINKGEGRQLSCPRCKTT